MTLSRNYNIGLLWMFDLQKWMWMMWGLFAFLANVVIFANWAFVANSLKISYITFLANDSMNDFWFFRLNLFLFLAFDRITNRRLSHNLFLNLLNHLRQVLFEFVLDLRTCNLYGTWNIIFFLFDFFFNFLLLFRNLYFLDKINEFLFLLGFFGVYLLSKFLYFII